MHWTLSPICFVVTYKSEMSQQITVGIWMYCIFRFTDIGKFIVAYL